MKEEVTQVMAGGKRKTLINASVRGKHQIHSRCFIFSKADKRRKTPKTSQHMNEENIQITIGDKMNTLLSKQVKDVNTQVTAGDKGRGWGGVGESILWRSKLTKLTQNAQNVKPFKMCI